MEGQIEVLKTCLDTQCELIRDLCCSECERTEEELHVAEGRIEVLMAHLDTQHKLIQDLFAHVESMGGKLCYCGKGKAQEPFREVSLVLGSPLVLGREVTCD